MLIFCYFVNFDCQIAKEVNWLSFSNQDIIFKSDSDAFLTDVKAWLARENHAWGERLVFVEVVVAVETDMMRHAVHEVFAIKWLLWILIINVLLGE